MGKSKSVTYIGNGISGEIKEILERDGFTVFEAPEDNDLKVFEDHGLDLVILDDKIDRCSLEDRRVCRLDSFVRQVRSFLYRTKILVYSEDDYILKHFSNIAHLPVLRKTKDHKGLLRVVKDMLHVQPESNWH